MSSPYLEESFPSLRVGAPAQVSTAGGRGPQPGGPQPLVLLYQFPFRNGATLNYGWRVGIQYSLCQFLVKTISLLIKVNLNAWHNDWKWSNLSWISFLRKCFLKKLQFLKNSAKVAGKYYLLAFSWSFFDDFCSSWSRKETVIPGWKGYKSTKFSLKKPWHPVAIFQNIKLLKFWKIFCSISTLTSIKHIFNSCHQRNCILSSGPYLSYFKILWWGVIYVQIL